MATDKNATEYLIVHSFGHNGKLLTREDSHKVADLPEKKRNALIASKHVVVVKQGANATKDADTTAQKGAK